MSADTPSRPPLSPVRNYSSSSLTNTDAVRQQKQQREREREQQTQRFGSVRSPLSPLTPSSSTGAGASAAASAFHGASSLSSTSSSWSRSNLVFGGGAGGGGGSSSTIASEAGSTSNYEPFDASGLLYSGASSVATTNYGKSLTQQQQLQQQQQQFLLQSQQRAQQTTRVQPVVSFELPGPLNAISASPSADAVVLAGREVLKILKVKDDKISEDVNLRSGSKLNLNYSSNDVKWCNAYAKNIIATAATNGAVVIWDLYRSSGQKQERVINEHTRAVNRICFHPTEPVLLLSASQDGTMKLWDLRAKNLARHTFEGKSESVRDVQFSPLGAYEFAAAFENGTVQKWDLRVTNQCERKVNAHNGLSLTLDWHPDGRHLASGGRDKLIKVWDMKADNRKPLHTAQTIASVARVAWRPGYPFQLACSGLLSDNRVHVFSFSRPYIPIYSLEVHDNVISGFIWKSADVIWTCSKDKFFASSDLTLGAASRPVEYLPSIGIVWNPNGDLAILGDRNAQDISALEDESPPIMNGLSSMSAPTMLTASSTEKLGDLNPTATATTTSSIFAYRKQPSSNLPVRTPTTIDESVSEFRKLQIYQPRQIMGALHVPGGFDAQAFIFMAKSYVLKDASIHQMCQHNAMVADAINCFHVAQTWRLIDLFFGHISDHFESEYPGHISASGKTAKSTAGAATAATANTSAAAGVAVAATATATAGANAETMNSSHVAKQSNSSSTVGSKVVATLASTERVSENNRKDARLITAHSKSDFVDTTTTTTLAAAVPSDLFSGSFSSSGSVAGIASISKAATGKIASATVSVSGLDRSRTAVSEMAQLAGTPSAPLNGVTKTLDIGEEHQDAGLKQQQKQKMQQQELSSSAEQTMDDDSDSEFAVFSDMKMQVRDDDDARHLFAPRMGDSFWLQDYLKKSAGPGSAASTPPGSPMYSPSLSPHILAEYRRNNESKGKSSSSDSSPSMDGASDLALPASTIPLQSAHFALTRAASSSSLTNRSSGPNPNLNLNTGNSGRHLVLENDLIARPKALLSQNNDRHEPLSRQEKLASLDMQQQQQQQQQLMGSSKDQSGQEHSDRKLKRKEQQGQAEIQGSHSNSHEPGSNQGYLASHSTEKSSAHEDSKLNPDSADQVASAIPNSNVEVSSRNKDHIQSYPPPAWWYPTFRSPEKMNENLIVNTEGTSSQNGDQQELQKQQQQQQQLQQQQHEQQDIDRKQRQNHNDTDHADDDDDADDNDATRNILSSEEQHSQSDKSKQEYQHADQYEDQDQNEMSLISKKKGYRRSQQQIQLQQQQQPSQLSVGSMRPPSVTSAPDITNTAAGAGGMAAAASDILAKRDPRKDSGLSVHRRSPFDDWDHEAVVNDLLLQYAAAGDVQTCVAVTLVLRDRIRISKKNEEEWFYAYIDLLHRFRLWVPAAFVISASKQESVRRYNQESTTIHTTCGNCMKPMLSQKAGYWACEHCSKVNSPCSICHETVKKLFVWCQGCGHGGHLHHMRSWFASNTQCPTGCGHRCNELQSR